MTGVVVNGISSGVRVRSFVSVVLIGKWIGEAAPEVRVVNPHFLVALPPGESAD
jgi:hypothetical protein